MARSECGASTLPATHERNDVASLRFPLRRYDVRRLSALLRRAGRRGPSSLVGWPTVGSTVGSTAAFGYATWCGVHFDGASGLAGSWVLVRVGPWRERVPLAVFWVRVPRSTALTAVCPTLHDSVCGTVIRSGFRVYGRSERLDRRRTHHVCGATLKNGVVS